MFDVHNYLKDQVSSKYIIGGMKKDEGLIQAFKTRKEALNFFREKAKEIHHTTAPLCSLL